MAKLVASPIYTLHLARFFHSLKICFFPSQLLQNGMNAIQNLDSQSVQFHQSKNGTFKMHYVVPFRTSSAQSDLVIIANGRPDLFLNTRAPLPGTTQKCDKAEKN